MKTRLILLSLLSLSLAGCITRDNTRYGADGKPWSRDKVTFFMVRGEATKVSERVKETDEGDYERTVTIGAIKGESELDKLGPIIDAAVKAAVQAAMKSIVPVPLP